MKFSANLFHHRNFLLVVLALVVIVTFINERSQIQSYVHSQTAQYSILSVPSDYVRDENEGKLIHLQGDLQTQEVLSDELFGVQVPALRLRRTVQMYQWEESIEQVSSGAELPVYEKSWLDTPIDSSDFLLAQYQNPAQFPYQRFTRQTTQATLGVFQVDPKFLEMLEVFEPYRYVQDAPEGFVLREGLLYSGNPDFPSIGDVRIGFEVVLPQAVSVVGYQASIGITPVSAMQLNQDIARMMSGALSIRQMGLESAAVPSLWPWCLRIASIFLVYWLADTQKRRLFHWLTKVPKLQHYTHMPPAAILFVLSVWSVLIAIGAMWFPYRPLVSSILVVSPLILIVLGHYLFRSYDV